MNSFLKPAFEGIIWLLIAMGPMILSQRVLHREIQLSFLQFTRDRSVTLVLFSILFLPGIIIHELSHLIAAFLLRVHIVKISLIPKLKSDRVLQMGFVVTERVDIIREALIGISPLLMGGFVISAIALVNMDLQRLWEPMRSLDWKIIVQEMQAIRAQPDFYIWFFLLFVVSSTMLPSGVDFKAIFPLLCILGVLVAFIWWISNHFISLSPLYGVINSGFKSIATIFALSAGINILSTIPIWFCRILIQRIFRMKIVVS